jgi:hypothetical protein
MVYRGALDSLDRAAILGVVMGATRRVKHAWRRALGSEDLPARFTLPDGDYLHVRTYKHDFFAATGLYEGPGGRVILKVGRTARWLGLPMAWLGRWLCRRELAIYQRAEGVEGVPRCLGGLGPTGLLHAFVEGHPLQRGERVDDAFFGRLERLLSSLHQRDIAYADLEKRENILVDADGRPALIDFQISWCWPRDQAARPRGPGRFLPGFIGRYILTRLRAADQYHLLKHWRRHRPDLLTAEQLHASYQVVLLIRLHRRISWPFTRVRRSLLKLLTGRSRSPKQDGPQFVDPPPSR